MWLVSFKDQHLVCLLAGLFLTLSLLAVVSSDFVLEGLNGMEDFPDLGASGVPLEPLHMDMVERSDQHNMDMDRDMGLNNSMGEDYDFERQFTG